MFDRSKYNQISSSDAQLPSRVLAGISDLEKTLSSVMLCVYHGTGVHPSLAAPVQLANLIA